MYCQHSYLENDDHCIIIMHGKTFAKIAGIVRDRYGEDIALHLMLRARLYKMDVPRAKRNLRETILTVSVENDFH